MTTAYCAGIVDNNVGCTKRDQCAMYRLWWETPNTDMHLCSLGSFKRFVPLQLQPAIPQPIYSTPIGRTMELFA